MKGGFNKLEHVFFNDGISWENTLRLKEIKLKYKRTTLQVLPGLVV